MINNVIESRNNKRIVLCEWHADEPQAVLVLAHGAAEHIYRYKHFANFLASNGITVIGYNQIGHGDNRAHNHEGVYFGPEDGANTLVNDFEDVCLAVYRRYTHLPLFVMGHSMGSMVVRGFAIQTKLMVNGIIICGTLHPDNKTLTGGSFLANLICKTFGKDKYSKRLNKIAFGNLEQIISVNEENIKNYKADKNCGNMFANKSIYDLIQLMKRITSPINISQMLKTNYFIISGQEDAFSHKTKDLQPFLEQLKRDNFVYQTKFYPNMKHEILNEKDNAVVYEDILNFIRNHDQ